MGIRIARRLKAAMGVCTVLSATALAPGIPSARWRSSVTLEGAGPGQPLEQAEIWMQGVRMRIETRGTGSERNFALEADGEVYFWTEGQPTGTRMAAGLAARSGRPSHGYVRRIQEIRSRGQRIGVETVDGHVCDVFGFENPLAGKGTYWLAQDLRGFPVRAVVERREVLPIKPGVELLRVKLGYRNTDIRIPGEFPPELLDPPANVHFRDVTELMLKGPVVAPRR